MHKDRAAIRPVTFEVPNRRTTVASTQVLANFPGHRGPVMVVGPRRPSRGPPPSSYTLGHTTPKYLRLAAQLLQSPAPTSCIAIALRSKYSFKTMAFRVALVRSTLNAPFHARPILKITCFEV